ncbi:S10 family peptidase [Burkholderia alba]|uniref:S10 family peptidase n=1 Tax=Burkholderia alba TaxID=2683677 RepID=UPI002B052045|nr:peptidase S10 [Burkholderia alba]
MKLIRTRAGWAVVCAALLVAACGGDDSSIGMGPSVSSSASASNAGAAGQAAGAAADAPYQDPNTYSFRGSASLSAAAAVEKAAVTHHQIVLNGKTVNYTATAGHLTASDPGTGKPEASFFYVAYTVDGQPANTRPVTFFYNGGPGSPTVWLHLGSFGPKRLVTGMPNANTPTPFPLVDNQETLLDTSDLVFVDAIGTGYSQAIAPNTNKTFWGVDKDGQAFRDFVIRYVAANQRGASPKYLFGESYGTPRTDVLANLLEVAGVKLAGVVLQSSILNYNSNCDMSDGESCGGFVPSYGLVGGYYRLDKPNPIDLAQYATQMRTLTADRFEPAVQAYLRTGAQPSPDLIAALSNATGASTSVWQRYVNLDPGTYRAKLLSGTAIGRYDARVNVPVNSPLNGGDPSSTYITKPFTDTIATYLPNVLKYTVKTTYGMSNNETIGTWNWRHDGLAMPDTVPDLAAALTLNPSLKILSLNGYHDLATPFYQTELDLGRLGAQPNLTIRNYQGGHMVYLDDTSRPQEKADLVTFYNRTPAAR